MTSAWALNTSHNVTQHTRYTYSSTISSTKVQDLEVSGLE